jgi:hypothetical protein
MSKTGFCSSENDGMRSRGWFPRLANNAKLSRNSTNSKDKAVLEVLLHLLTLFNGRKDNDDWKLCLFGLSYLDHFCIDLFGFELAINVQRRYSFRNGSSGCENHRVFEEGGEFSLALVTSECSCHANDCVFIEEEDC